ncbi:hydroxysteroid 11-beta-dehydrogenase 1-like protein [Tubulanus polymorphus]|uniref:hydroxysteroid 11-beta-dehydrogenase 1-like protein n=1 Tax=Tubulanus polymorphus TaxID=672921 RepID=UPI003DA41977
MSNVIKLLSGLVLVISIYLAYQKLYILDRVEIDNIKGKRVLITGASAGIGEQLAYHYAKYGAKIVLTARTEKVLQKVVKKCKEIGNGLETDYHYIAADMSENESPSRVITTAVEKLNGLDVLVLNHIWPQEIRAWKNSQDDLAMIDKLMRVNFLSHVHLATHAMPYLEKHDGQVIVVSSWAAYLSDPYLAAYSSTKSALTSYFTSLQKELQLKQSPVTITICHLGFISTANAINFVKHSPYSIFISRGEGPSDTALSIVKAGSTRQPHLVYPYLLGLYITNFPQFHWNVLMKYIIGAAD